MAMPEEWGEPATASEIRAIVGDLDEVVVASIAATGASAADAVQAVQWFGGGGGLNRA